MSTESLEVKEDIESNENEMEPQMVKTKKSKKQASGEDTIEKTEIQENNTGASQENEEDERSGEIEAVKAELEEKTKEAAKHLDSLLRVKADFENYKKRISKEQSESYKYANEKLIAELLTVIDNLERAIESADKTQDNTEALKEGIEMVAQQFATILKNAGLEQIECLNEPFDPEQHEALSQIESDDHEVNTVVQEFQKGYFFKDRVLRHSKVIVSKKSEQKDDSKEQLNGSGEENTTPEQDEGGENTHG